MGIDFSINIGVVVQTIVILGGGLIVYGALRQSVKSMEHEILEIKKDQRNLASAVASIAVQDSRLNRLEQDLRDLRHGRGFVLDRPNDGSQT